MTREENLSEQMQTEIGLAALQPILTRYGAAGRSALLPALIEAQRLYGYLPEAIAEEIGRALRVPLAEVYGVIEFYTMLYSRPTGRTLIRVCSSPMCAQQGGHRALQAACAHLGVEASQPTVAGEYEVEEVPCLGLCDHAPAALVGDLPVGRIDVNHTQAWIESPQAVGLGSIVGEPRWLTARCGVIDPIDLSAFVAHGGFDGLRRALSMLPAEVIEEIKTSKLTGRGGAAFPTGLKWEMAAHAAGNVRYVVCNADESEPGTFKDRVLMEGDPFSILEGMLIAGYAIGARRGYLYVRGEFMRAQKILQHAIDAAYANGYLGKHVLDSDFEFDIELRSGAGAYICGEESALFESIEGKRGFPRIKPPFPTTHGLFGKPTVINNVETLCAATWIIARGVEAYQSCGTTESPGTKLFCLSGDVARPGVVEAPLGIALGELIEMAGGAISETQAILLGGAAGMFVRPDQLDVPMSFEGLRARGLALGSGVVMLINRERDLRQTLSSLAHFFAHESCGKCYPCQLGTQRQLEIVDKVKRGAATPGDLDALRDIEYTMTNASLCGLGMTAGTAIGSALQLWPEVFRS